MPAQFTHFLNARKLDCSIPNPLSTPLSKSTPHTYQTSHENQVVSIEEVSVVLAAMLSLGATRQLHQHVKCLRTLVAAVNADFEPTIQYRSTVVLAVALCVRGETMSQLIHVGT
jgi:hypothetical protein